MFAIMCVRRGSDHCEGEGCDYGAYIHACVMCVRRCSGNGEGEG